jgi:hypothetical protein
MQQIRHNYYRSSQKSVPVLVMEMKMFRTVLRIRIRDPVLFYPPDPGSGMEQWSDPGSGISKQNL